MEEQKKLNVIDLHEVVHKIWKSRKLYMMVWIITFVVACLWILPQPRTYQTSVMLAPENASSSISASDLGSLAMTMGFNMGGATGGDAIYPLLYPDVVESNDFIVSLFNIPVKTIDGEVECDYLTYLVEHQKVSIWSYPKILLMKGIKSLFPSEEGTVGTAGRVNPFRLSKKEFQIVEGVRGSVRCSVDKKTDVITLNVADQDPLICATLADSVRVRLQEFITEYRTSKARIDVEYYERMKAETYADYQNSVQAYSRFCDAHRDVILQSMQSQRDNLENDMQMKFNTYNAMSTQLDAAKAKVQERTPAFTVLQNASVPTKASSPKRMVFVALMLFLATIVTSLYVVRKDLHFSF